MSISILNRGASGGLKPEIAVTSLVGSTIDILKNGIIIDTYALGANETEHIFPVRIGTYIVRGTLGDDVRIVTVNVDVVGRYEVEIYSEPNYLMLYDFGDECTAITGGWTGQITQTVAYYSGTKSKLKKNSNNFTNPSMAFRQYHSLVSAKMIDSSEYDYVGMMCDYKTTDCTTAYFGLNTSATNDGEGTTRNGWARGIGYDYGVLPTTKAFSTALINNNNMMCYGVIVINGGGSPSTGSIYTHATFILKEDNWSGVSNIAGITASTMGELLEKSEVLLSNELAVQLMVSQCTGNFMIIALSNSTFMTALANSAYKNTVYGNKHWAKFLAMIQ